MASGTIQANGVDGIGIASTSLFGVATVADGTGTHRGNASASGQDRHRHRQRRHAVKRAFGTNGRAVDATGDTDRAPPTAPAIRAMLTAGRRLRQHGNVDNSGRIEAMGTVASLLSLSPAPLGARSDRRHCYGRGRGHRCRHARLTGPATINGGTNGVGSGIVRNRARWREGGWISFIGTGPDTLICSRFGV